MGFPSDLGRLLKSPRVTIYGLSLFKMAKSYRPSDARFACSTANMLKTKMIRAECESGINEFVSDINSFACVCKVAPWLVWHIKRFFDIHAHESTLIQRRRPTGAGGMGLVRYVEFYELESSSDSRSRAESLRTPISSASSSRILSGFERTFTAPASSTAWSPSEKPVIASIGRSG